MKKIGFVTPWYGENIPGGAEMETREVIAHLKAVGLNVEVLTTCVKEFASDWFVNYHRPGIYKEDGVTVRRFAVRKGDGNAFQRINTKLLNGARISKEEEQIFFTNIVNSDALYSFMKKHEEEYSLFIFIPYMFGTTYNGMRLFPKKSVVIPCLHDECYAYLGELRKCFSQVKGIVYNALPEYTLANRLYYLKDVYQIVMGIGMETDITGEAGRFQKKYHIKNPFILYAGRKDKTKNVHMLLEYFNKYKQEKQSDLQLVLIGPGELPIPESCRHDVHDLGFVSMQDKYDAYAAAMALCQPSKNESFSFVIMESWLMKRPVLVHADCKVTTNFAVESNGGFYFKNYYEFAEEVEYLLGNPQIADRLGEQGREYVINHFSWDIITKKYVEFLSLCTSEENEEKADEK